MVKDAEKTPIWRILEYMETVMEYYGVKHEGCSMDKFIRKFEYLERLRKEEAARKFSLI